MQGDLNCRFTQNIGGDPDWFLHCVRGIDLLWVFQGVELSTRELIEFVHGVRLHRSPGQFHRDERWNRWQDFDCGVPSAFFSPNNRQYNIGKEILVRWMRLIPTNKVSTDNIRFNDPVFRSVKGGRNGIKRCALPGVRRAAKF